MLKVLSEQDAKQRELTSSCALGYYDYFLFKQQIDGG